jgi:hypothetical protein
MKVRSYAAIACIVCVLTTLALDRTLAAEANNKFVGRWMLTLKEPAGDLQGLLDIRTEGGKLVGRVEGGPIKLTINGNSIQMIVDSRDAGARMFDRTLTGTLENGQLAGTYVSNEVGRAKVPPRTWRALPFVEEKTSERKPQPVDLSGVWSPTSLADMRKYSMDLTPAAEAWVKNYDPELDQPALRCVSPGVVALFGWVYPFEIVQTKNEVIFFYEGYGQVRRVYTDGRKHPENHPESRMGHSVGRWDGSTFVVETTLLQPNIRDFRGEPLSSDARVVERYSLSEDGKLLSGVLTVHDPANYREPPIRRVVRRRDTATQILPYECDPDSFFRQLYEDKQMDEYMKRHDRRL